MPLWPVSLAMGVAGKDMLALGARCEMLVAIRCHRSTRHVSRHRVGEKGEVRIGALRKIQCSAWW